MKRRRALIIFVLLALLLVAAGGLWMHVQRQQYARNRKFVAALSNNDTEQALALVQAGADPNTQFSPLPPPSFRQPMLHIFLDNFRVADGRTALMWAASYGFEEKVKFLLAHGADVNAQDRDGNTALHFALMEYGNKSSVKQLLLYGANPNLTNRKEVTPLKLAQKPGANLEDIVALMQHGRK